PIIPTHVLDRSLNDANQLTDMVICRKAVFGSVGVCVSLSHSTGRHPELVGALHAFGLQQLNPSSS
ncbi:hypothetical protein, partial [Sphingorhabdus sp.]|uniref:hypothetical protein n=1 Tax=Sphingorhabdus sp. TaxID=1902408 RepID=UPI0039830B53